MRIDKILDTPTDIQQRHESRVCNIMFVYPLIKVEIQFKLPLQYDLYFLTHCFQKKKKRNTRYGYGDFAILFFPLKEFNGRTNVNNSKSCIRQRTSLSRIHELYSNLIITKF